MARVREELLELLEEVNRTIEKDGDLLVDALDRSLIALVGLKNLEELLVGIGFRAKAIFDLVDIINRMVKLDRSFAVLCWEGPSVMWGLLETSEETRHARGARMR